MGGTPSKDVEKEPLQLRSNTREPERVYRPPDVRKRDRFETSDNYGSHQTTDNSIDKVLNVLNVY